MHKLPIEVIKSAVDYDANTGAITWRHDPSRRSQWNGVWAGRPAGTVMQDGYVRLQIRKCRYPAHWIAWLLGTGHWPNNEIDHINGIKSDSRLTNLREADRFQNSHNRPNLRSNTSGYKGVCFDKTTGKWQAQIKKNKIRKYLGQFPTAEEAHRAYCEAAAAMHGEFARTG